MIKSHVLLTKRCLLFVSHDQDAICMVTITC